MVHYGLQSTRSCEKPHPPTYSGKLGRSGIGVQIQIDNTPVFFLLTSQLSSNPLSRVKRSKVNTLREHLVSRSGTVTGPSPQGSLPRENEKESGHIVVQICLPPTFSDLKKNGSPASFPSANKSWPQGPASPGHLRCFCTILMFPYNECVT